MMRVETRSNVRVIDIRMVIDGCDIYITHKIMSGGVWKTKIMHKFDIINKNLNVICYICDINNHIIKIS